VTITVVADSQEGANSAINAAFEEFSKVDALMSIHREESEISRVNAQAAKGFVKISEELYEVMAKAMEISRETEGAFDITIGPLAQLWGFIWKEYRLPTKEELERVLPLVDYRAVELSGEQMVRFQRRGMSLDLGGIGKGYAVDRAVERLQQLGIRAAMVKAGGDLRVYGRPIGKQGWEVQLEDAEKNGKRKVINLENAALSTSGNYENYFEVEGRRYSHIINPKNGLPVEGIAACIVIAPTCLESDALATAFFVYGPERSLSKFGEVYPMQFTFIEGGVRRGKALSSNNFPD
jgi:FAD:protein FMN transferase